MCVVCFLGECGCGKTMLLSYLCGWLGVTLLSLDVHGGTSEEEIIAIFDQAAAVLEASEEISVTASKVGGGGGGRATAKDSFSFQSTVFVFLDEVNTCAHMGLM